MKFRFEHIVILVLLCIVIFQRCGGNNTTCPEISKTDSVKTTDTVFVPVKGTVTTAPKLYSAELPESIPEEYVAKGSYDLLLDQYKTLLADWLSEKEYRDTLRKDSSALYLTTKVQKNAVLSNHYDFDLRLPVITNTLTITNTVEHKKRRQLYIGGELAGNDQQLIDRIGVGLLYKDRKDRMFGIGADLHASGIVSYNLKSYWKLSFK